MRGKPFITAWARYKTRITPAGAGKTSLCDTYFADFWDHPRRCGENFNAAPSATIASGSPPQVRGKPPLAASCCPHAKDHPRRCGENTYAHAALYLSVPGITPAGAGKTGTKKSPTLAKKDHPRRCGENYTWDERGMGLLGSPPQVRGKHLSQRGSGDLTRITPAGAGKTGTSLKDGHEIQDHPRRCGENRADPESTHTRTGSPPQVRGKLEPLCAVISVRGITPAGAGKTSISVRTNAFAEDHPRRCGENRKSVSQTALGWGSPPQVRGKPRTYLYCSSVTGITPAGAGKTKATLNERFVNQDHPRRCGENQIPNRHTLQTTGSPPQVRGKLDVLHFFFTVLGITPAGAGKTCIISWRNNPLRDHPRRCGENPPHVRHQPFAKGSPPQVRGKQGHRYRAVDAQRITPAGAGKTALPTGRNR